MDATYQDHLRDDQLVARVVIGDIKAFDVLVRRYRQAAVIVAKSILGSQEAAEDVAQESLLIAYKAMPQLSESERFASWLCAITRNRARKAGASKRTQPERPLSEFDALLLRKSCELARQNRLEGERSSMVAEVLAAIGELSVEVSEPMSLFYVEGWSAQRIADFLRLPLTTVKWRLHQGRRRLRTRLGHNLEDNYV